MKIFTIACLAIMLSTTVPVNAAPSLHGNSKVTYDLSASVSISQSCRSVAGTVCPMLMPEPQSILVNGTVSWALAKLTHTNANLDVNRDLSVVSDNKTPLVHSKGSLNESIDLATRLSSFIFPDTSELHSILMTIPSMPSLAPSLASVNGVIPSHSIYTMWWVNGPIARDQKVPVLFFSTTVKDSTTVNLGSLGNRPAWRLVYNVTNQDHDRALEGSAISFLYRYDSKALFTFNYDQKSDLLLTATADVQSDFYDSGCGVSNFPCPMTGSSVPSRELSYDVHASLKLASTNLSLDTERMQIQTSGQETTTSTETSGQSGTGTGSTSGPASASGSDSQNVASSKSTQSNHGPASNPSSSGSSVSGPNSNGSVPTKSGILPPTSVSWLYWMIGIVIVGIVGAAAFLRYHRHRN